MAALPIAKRKQLLAINARLQDDFAKLVALAGEFNAFETQADLNFIAPFMSDLESAITNENSVPN